MSVYLDNPVTKTILFKPVRVKILHVLTRIKEILCKLYEDCPELLAVIGIIKTTLSRLDMEEEGGSRNLDSGIVSVTGKPEKALLPSGVGAESPEPIATSKQEI